MNGGIPKSKCSPSTSSGRTVLFCAPAIIKGIIMANVTFSSPKMKKDITVYATAGDRSTLLAVAREHSIPLDFECQDGECGSCAVQVTVLENKQPLGVNLTE